MVQARRTINIEQQIFMRQAHALYFLRSAGCIMSCSNPTKPSLELSIIIDVIEPSEAETTRLREKTQQSDFPAQHSATCCETSQKNVRNS